MNNKRTAMFSFWNRTHPTICLPSAKPTPHRRTRSAIFDVQFHAIGIASFANIAIIIHTIHEKSKPIRNIERIATCDGFKYQSLKSPEIDGLFRIESPFMRFLQQRIHNFSILDVRFSQMENIRSLLQSLDDRNHLNWINHRHTLWRPTPFSRNRHVTHRIIIFSIWQRPGTPTGMIPTAI